MIDHERALLTYLKLADVAWRKGQRLGRDKLLVLAGAAALRAGWPDVAEGCRAAVVASSPRHLLGKYDTFANAMRDADFQPFLRRTERFCPFEQAEALLAGLGLDADETSEADTSVGARANRLLGPMRENSDIGDANATNAPDDPASPTDSE